MDDSSDLICLATPPAAPRGEAWLSAFGQAAAGLVLADAHGRICRGNPVFADMAGQPLSELAGREFVGLHADEDEARALRRRIARLQEGEVEHCRMELRFEPDWDRLTWVDATATAQRDARGVLQAITFVLLDITERKRRDAFEMQRMGLALQSAGLGLWEWRVASGAMSFDLYWAMTLGFAVSELAPHIGTWHALEHPDDQARVDASRLPCLTGEAAEYRVEHRMRHKQGHWVWLVDSGMVIERGESGRPERVLGTSQDITLRKQAEAALMQSRQRQAMALQSAKLGQWEWRLPTGETVFDARFCEMLGYAPDELPPHVSSWQRLDFPDTHDELLQSMAACLAGEQDEFCCERRLRHKQGHAVWVLDFGRVIERGANGRAVHLVGLYQDISERKQHEEDLRQAMLAADAANRAKSGFLANMSHEIRTPMNAMIGLTRLVLDTELSVRQRDYLQKVHASAKSLLSILNDILDHSKIEAGRLRLDEIQFPLEEPLNNVAALFGAQVEQKGLELFFELAPDLPMEVVGDPLRLTQVLGNLVSNAIKFTERGQIHLKASLDERGAEHLQLRFSVTDTGIGLSPEQINRLFQAFHQADNSITRKYGGTGLGLTISEQLVGMMGGQIGVESVEGEGCTFTFTVRMAPAVTEQLSMDLHRVRGLRALVVDDQDTSQQILRNLFEAWGMEAHTAGSAEEGLALIAAAYQAGRPYDVVLLDWRMPGMNGVEMAHRMREDAACRPGGVCPPFAIMVTAYGHEQLVQERGDLPLDMVLTKPVVPSALFDILVQMRAGPETRRSVIGTRPLEAIRLDGARLLLVEDNLLNQEVACEFLRGFGADVTVACNGAEAVERVAGGHFDLVLMDMHMPVMGGVAATEHIKATAAGRTLPIVAMTAAVMSEDRALCEAAGMVDFVPKPVDPDELLRVLGRCLPQRATQPAAPPQPAAPAGPFTDTAAWLPDFAGFDPDAALRRLHGHRGRLLHLLQAFAREHAHAASDLDALLVSGQLDRAQALLHTIKGTAGTLGLVGLAEAARVLEATLAAPVPVPTGATPSSHALAQAIADLRAALQAQAPASPPPLAAAMPAAERVALARLARDLRGYLQEQELVPDELVDEIKRLSALDLPGSPLAALDQHIFDFDHAAALAVLDTLTTLLTPDTETTP